MKQLVLKSIALAATALALVSSAHAGTATANFQSTATLGSTCVISASNIAFGSINPAATGTATANGAFTAVCTKGSAYTITVNAGSSTVATARTMAGAATGNTDKLAYNIYTDAAHANILADGTTGTSKFTSAGTGATQTFPVYGNLNLNQYVTPDNYTDSLTATLTY